MSKERHVKEILLLSLFLLASFGVGIISFISSDQQARNTTSAEASSHCKCDDNDKCYPDGCSRKPKTENNTFNEERYNSVCGDSSLDPGYRMPDGLIQHFCSEQQPSCCFDIAKHKDDRLCCFQERWTCHPSLCEGASGNGDCGKYWNLPDNGWTAYGCVKEGSNGEEIPYWGLPPGLPNGNSNQNPTNTPIPPTNRPTQPLAQNTPTTTQVRPTIADPTPTRQQAQTINTVIPTQPGQPSPTSSDTFAFDFNDDEESGNFGNNPQQQNPQNTNQQAQTNNNDSPQSTNQNNSFEFNMPEIELKTPKQMLRESIDQPTVEKLNQVTDKPLTVAKTSFTTIKTYDKKLEDTVESWLFNIRITITRFIQ